MTFQAIVFAPFLRKGARLCIADLEQTVTTPPKRISIKSNVNLRFGTCCPTLAAGTITDFVESAETAVLTVEGRGWNLKRCPQKSGVSIPGMISENWFVE